MAKATWWLLVPGVIGHAVFTFAVYETLRYWPFAVALAVHDINFERFSAEANFIIWLQTLADMGIAFSAAHWLASTAVSYFFEPSDLLYDRVRRASEAPARLQVDKRD
jgi:hypothetical protein